MKKTKMQCSQIRPQWNNCAVWDTVCAHTDIFDCFNRVSSPFRQAWLCSGMFFMFVIGVKICFTRVILLSFFSGAACIPGILRAG